MAILKSEKTETASMLSVLFSQKQMPVQDKTQLDELKSKIDQLQDQLNKAHDQIAALENQIHLNIQNLFQASVSELKSAHYIDAVGLLQAVLIHNPNHLNARLNLSIAYHELGFTDRAIHTLESVLALDPENRIAKANLAVLSSQTH